TRGQLGKVRQQFAPIQLLTHHHLAMFVHAMHLEHVLGDVQSNSRYLHCPLPFSLSVIYSLYTDFLRGRPYHTKSALLCSTYPILVLALSLRTVQLLSFLRNASRMAEGKIDDKTTRDRAVRGHTASCCIAVVAYCRLVCKGKRQKPRSTERT